MGESPCSSAPSPAVLRSSLNGPKAFLQEPGKGAVDFHVRWGRWERLETGGPGEQKASSLHACRAWCGREWGMWAVADRWGVRGWWGAGAGAVTVKEG